MQEISFTLNGEPRTVPIRPKESLLETLRTRCGVYSPKDGCQPQGQCGCCLALVDGVAKTACAVPAAKELTKQLDVLIDQEQVVFG